MSLKSIFLVLAVLLVVGCQSSDETFVTPLLTGRAILPADTFSDGPTVGHQLDPQINGRSLPFASVPVQGFSSLISDGDDTYVALQDNGFGSLANSPAFPLRWYRLQLDLESGKPQGGPVTILETVTLSDPHQRLKFPLAQSGPGRVLHGADFDPESFVRLDDGSFWVGEEFGPSLLHFDARGQLLAAPVPVPVVPPLSPYARGSFFLHGPDHPQLRFANHDQLPDQLANLPQIGGIEGLARNSAGTLLYAAVEKPLRDDPDQRRRTILEFDPVQKNFTPRFWFYRADHEGCSIASLESFSDRVFLVTERDEEEGAAAAVKKIYRVALDELDEDGYLKKTLVCDLLKIRDAEGFSTAEEGAVGLGPDYAFPYVTPESLIILDTRTLLVCNDNNYPMSTGRRPPHTPDDNEFIRLRLAEPLKP